MDFRYGLDERPPWTELLLYGLQWLAIAVPSVVIIGKTVATLQFADPLSQITYLQKLSFVVGATLLVQIRWGHRLPLVAGPSAVLLVGVAASRGFPPATVYTALGVGGLVLAFLSLSGLFVWIQRLFTPRVVAVVLLLIAFTLAPTILHLLVGSLAPQAALRHLAFALGLLAAAFWGQGRLSGVWKSTLVVWMALAGTLGEHLLFATSTTPAAGLPAMAGFWRQLTLQPSFDPGVILSFLLCFLALAINDLGSIQATLGLLEPSDARHRLTRGMAVTGLAGGLAGLLGVLGPVDFSLSPGVVASTGCASRWTLAPAGVVLVALAFSPAALAWFGAVPPVVVGCVLLYILCAQIAAGLLVAFGAPEGFGFEDGLTIGLPLLLGTLVAFLPPEIPAALPPLVRPVAANGFVVGVMAALAAEHGVRRR